MNCKNSDWLSGSLIRLASTTDVSSDAEHSGSKTKNRKQKTETNATNKFAHGASAHCLTPRAMSATGVQAFLQPAFLGIYSVRATYSVDLVSNVSGRE